uniref:Translin-associated factor X interacting protein 1 n=1 Tax=Electrophorus electricus TaxID=8005 RepID=A0A4W4HEB2_ELEEL
MPLKHTSHCCLLSKGNMTPLYVCIFFLLSFFYHSDAIGAAYLQEQIRELEPLRAQLVLLSEQCEQRILGLRELERAEIRAVKQEQQHLLQVIESMKEQQRGLQTQVCHLKEELAAQYLLYREERDARKLLIASISNMSYMLKDDDPVKEKLALKVCREDLSRAQVELNRLHAEYGDVVPRRDWENLDCMYQENLLKCLISLLQLQTLQSDFDQMKSEYDTLLGVHREVSMQRDSLQSELEVFQEASTPRPHWEQCADVIGSRERCSQLLDGQSSQKRLEILLEELSSISLEQKEFFTGLGRSSDVPIYLHYEGQLRNLRLKKNDVLRIIKDIWKGKLDASSDLKEFLHKYLERQHGDQAGEWAYSLLDAIKRYLKDDFIGLFYDILTGKVDESLYHGQTLLLSHLLKVFIQTDSAETGLLTLSEFSEALRMAFPLKGEQDIEELVVAAQSNQETSKGSIAYQRLYTEVSSKTLHNHSTKCTYMENVFSMNFAFTWLTVASGVTLLHCFSHCKSPNICRYKGGLYHAYKICILYDLF